MPKIKKKARKPQKRSKEASKRKTKKERVSKNKVVETNESKIYLVTRDDRSQIVARKWTEEVANTLQINQKNCRIYRCKEQVEMDLRPNAFEYNYIFSRKKENLYLINACANYGDRLKALELVERFFDIYPTPLIIDKQMTYMVKSLTKEILEKK